MAEAYVLLFTGGIGLLTTFILISNNQSNKMINYYLIIICLYLSCFAFLKATSTLGIQEVFDQKSFGYKRLSLFLFPSLFLYFQHVIVASRKWRSTDFNHFIIPIGFFIGVQSLELFGYLSPKIISFLYVFYALFVFSYFLLSMRLFKTAYGIDSLKKLLETSGPPQKKWLLFLLFIFMLICLRVGIIVGMDVYNGTLSGFENVFWLWSILIIGIFIKLLVSPELLFGSTVLKKRIESHASTPISANHPILTIWKLEKATVFNNKQDAFLAPKVNETLLEKIHAIEAAVLKKALFRNSNFDMQMLALEIQIPKSHLTYVFKYHCNLFFPDFKRMLQIRDAKNLIDNGYLTANTLESLSAYVGFSSYNPFYQAFKKYTGRSPQHYLKQS